MDEDLQVSEKILVEFLGLSHGGASKYGKTSR